MTQKGIHIINHSTNKPLGYYITTYNAVYCCRCNYTNHVIQQELYIEVRAQVLYYSIN